MKKKFCLIGNGKMGSAFVNLIHPQFHMSVASPHTHPGYPAVYADDISQMKDTYDYICFAVKPLVLPQVLKNLRPSHYHKKTRFISLLAGTSSAVYRKALGQNILITNIMTNLPVKVGKGILAVHSDEKVDFLEKLGQVIYVKEEDDLNRYCAAVGSGSGFCYALFEMYQKAIQEVGVGGCTGCKGDESIDTRRLVLNLFRGSIDLLEESGMGFAEQKTSVVTPNGTTHAGLQELDKCGEIMRRTMDKSCARARELGEQVSAKIDEELGAGKKPN